MVRLLLTKERERLLQSCGDLRWLCLSLLLLLLLLHTPQYRIDVDLPALSSRRGTFLRPGGEPLLLLLSDQFGGLAERRCKIWLVVVFGFGGFLRR